MKIDYVKGDATLPIGEGKKLIVHICNNVGAWGAGFVIALSRRWKEPEAAYRKWYRDDGYKAYVKPFELGQSQFVDVGSDITVVNMIAQNNLISRTNPIPLRLESLKECLTEVNIYIHEHGGIHSIHMPRIGCGLAGGKWKDVFAVIEQTISPSVPITVYDL